MRFLPSVWLTIAAVSMFGSAGPNPAAAQPQLTVKDIFEKYNLIGIFSWDCSKPASNDNHYFVDRVIDADHVQRDDMSGPATRDHVTIVDKATALGPNEIAASGVRDGVPIDFVLRVEPTRHRAMESTQGGKKLVAGGHFVGNGQEVQWLNKCGQR